MESTSQNKKDRFLKEYQELIDEIKIMMIEDSNNSLQNMISNLNWDDTIYRTFNKGLALMWKANLQEKLPGTIVEYIHKSHLSLILSVLRKIFEPSRKGKRTVNSIPTIIKKIKDNIGYWTRENYVCYDGVPFDEIDTNDWRQKLIINDRHKKFDNMCVNNGIRKKEDRLSIDILNNLEKYAKLDSDIEVFVNNYMFHAASASARPNEHDVYSKTTLLKIQKQMKRAVWIILQLSKIVDQYVVTELATPQFVQLKSWEDSMFHPKIINRLEEYWKERVFLWSDWTCKYWNTDEIYISPNKIYRKDK